MSKRNRAHDAGPTISTAVSSLPVEDAVDAIGDVAVEAVEVAAATMTSTSRVAIRLVTRTIRFVARHPREVLIGVVLVTLIAGVSSALGQRDPDSARRA